MQYPSQVDLKEFVETHHKLVTRKESKKYPGLFVLKYARRVFYDNLWHFHPYLVLCRGLIVDANYNIVVKPFTKVFNYKENGTEIPLDEMCQAVRKVNGFLGVVTYDPDRDDPIVSTTGSLDSDFAEMARKHTQRFAIGLMRRARVIGKFTLMFEICDESDPHIIVEELGPWLIGGHMYNQDGVQQLNESCLDMMAFDINVMRPEHFRAKFSDILAMNKVCNHEGFMIYGDYGNSLKLKSPHYLITKFIGRMNDKKLMNTILNDQVLAAYKVVDEEFYGLVNYLREIADSFVVRDEQQKIKLIRDFLER